MSGFGSWTHLQVVPGDLEHSIGFPLQLQGIAVPDAYKNVHAQIVSADLLCSATDVFAFR